MKVKLKSKHRRKVPIYWQLDQKLLPGKIIPIAVQYNAFD
jgi:hypothetical protein